MTGADRVLAAMLDFTPLPNGWKAAIWSLLPDYCEMPGCCRKGVRGNENIVNGKIMCDYCTVRHGRKNQHGS